LHLYANYALHSRQNSETFDILHAFLSSVVAKLSDLKNSPVFLAYPVSLASCDLDLGALNPKIDHFMPVPHGPLVQSDIKIGSLVFKILCLQVWKQLNGQTDGWMNGWTT